MATGVTKLDVRKAVVSAGYFTFAIVLLYVFVRGWIEVGDERPWILLFVFTVPVFMAFVVAWTFRLQTWVVKAILGIATLIVAPVLLVQAALMADRIYENPT